MKLGICTNMNAILPDSTGLERMEEYARAGYDYVELPLAQLMALDEVGFAAKHRLLKDSGLACLACNNFFPQRIRLTGEDAVPAVAREYAGKALERVAKLGAGTVVFGSAGARNVAYGFPIRAAYQQFVDGLSRWAELAGLYGIRIAIEPLNRSESNIIYPYRGCGIVRRGWPRKCKLPPGHVSFQHR